MAIKEVEIPKRPHDLPGLKKATRRLLKGLCPWCGGTVEGGAVEIDGTSARQEVDCTECGKEWTEWYDLAAVTYYEPGKGQWTDPVKED